MHPDVRRDLALLGQLDQVHRRLVATRSAGTASERPFKFPDRRSAQPRRRLAPHGPYDRPHPVGKLKQPEKLSRTWTTKRGSSNPVSSSSSVRAKRISGPRKFRSSRKKDFFLSARSRHGASRIRRHRFGGEAFHRLTLSSHNTSSCNRLWATWAIIVVRQRMPASVLTAGRAQLAVVGLFGPRRVRPRTVAASPYRPR
jgi:hypothetical protein